MPLLMVRNDITKMQVDAVVNPANEELLMGSGTSYAIYQSAGEKALDSACRKIGYCPLTQAVVTEGFDLTASIIIHAVGPVYDQSSYGEEQLLYKTYQSALVLASKHKCKSVAFPLLSSGNYGFPKDLAMKIAMKAIQDFLWNHELMVYLVLYDTDSVEAGRKIFASIDEYIDDFYVEDNDEIIDGDEFYADLKRMEFKRNADFDNHASVQKMMSHASEIDFSEDLDQEYSFEDEIFLEETAPPLCKSLLPVPLQKQRSLEDLLSTDEETFSDMLFRLIDEKGYKDTDVYKRANMTRQHFNKLKKQDASPKKATVLALIIALRLTLDEAIDFLASAGYAFSKNSKTDIIVQYFIDHASYDINEVNEVLFYYDLTLFGV